MIENAWEHYRGTTYNETINMIADKIVTAIWLRIYIDERR